MEGRILWIEGKRAESPQFIPAIRKKGYKVEIVSTGSEAIDRISGFDPDMVVLNAASMRTSGKRICRTLREKANGVAVVVIAEPDFSAFSEIEANVVLPLPFTSRKLLNRIHPLMPGEGTHMLHVGPIRLDLERKRVRCLGRTVTLTPRLAQLLRHFMEHPGEALEREAIFRYVWNTEYTGDTRTLDVHISWLRQSIEEDPHAPKLIKTIRGIGYRLDI